MWLSGDKGCFSTDGQSQNYPRAPLQTLESARQGTSARPRQAASLWCGADGCTLSWAPNAQGHAVGKQDNRNQADDMLRPSHVQGQSRGSPHRVLVLSVAFAHWAVGSLV